MPDYQTDNQAFFECCLARIRTQTNRTRNCGATITQRDKVVRRCKSSNNFVWFYQARTVFLRIFTFFNVSKSAFSSVKMSLTRSILVALKALLPQKA